MQQLASVYPSPLTYDTTTETLSPLVYEIVASEQLPCFDPTITVKDLFLSKANALRITRAALTAKSVLIPIYFVGLALRAIDVFVPTRVGEALAVVSVVLQFPIIALVITAYRIEYVRVLVHTFEFYFLALTATIWVASALVYVRDLRAVLLPIAWIDFIDLVLIEAYFGDSHVMVLVAVVSGFFLTSLTAKLTLGGNDVTTASVALAAAATDAPVVSNKDVLANAMGTMVMLMIRLAFRKYAIAKRERHGASWTQSIGYRCRVALRAVPRVGEQRVLTQQGAASAPTAAPSLQPHANAWAPTAATVPSRTESSTTFRRAQPSRSLPMRFIEIPVRFRADATVCPRIGSTHSRLATWQLCALYGCGIVGYALPTLAMTAANKRDSRSISRNATEFAEIPILAIAGLCVTLAFCLWFVGCCQRELLRQLCTSYDFVFLSLQLIASHASVCDLLAWDWATCCSAAAELLWMHWALVLDALTPDMKARLRLRTWASAPVVFLHIVKHVALLTDMLAWNRWYIRNRLLLDTTIGGSAVQFRVFPFLFSRLVTILIWCVRILHRVRTRESENDLVMVLGNVEFDCRPTRLQDVMPSKRTASVDTPT